MPETPSTERFVNPYSFVGLPQAVPRTAPPGHDAATIGDEPLWYGSINVAWTLTTPLLLPAVDKKDVGWLSASGDLTIPGSSIKGAIRSVHEAMFNGCLRVVDSDFVPGYRDAARQDERPDDADTWRLAVVESLESGEAATMRLCERRAVWVEATSLARAYRSRLPETSDVFDLVGDIEDASLRGANGAEMRRVRAVGQPSQLAPTGEGMLSPEARAGRQVLLVTDTAARTRHRANRTARGRAFWAVGTLTDESAALSPEARKNFKRAVAGSRDRTESRRGGDAPAQGPQEVKWWPDVEGRLDNFASSSRAVGRRKPATGHLAVGDVVWVQTSEETGQPIVTAIKLSALWRHAGSGPVKTRIPAAVRPCAHPYAEDSDTTQFSGLCLSCVIFGSAETTGQRKGEGDQHAYAGHVRVGAATASSVRAREVDLAPMGAPHPGAGMFYLDPTRPGNDREKGDLPGQWGSSSDTPRRQLRGRKFYWHGNADDQAAFWSRQNGRSDGSVVPRYEARPGHRTSSAKFLRRATLVCAGTTLNQTIHVNGLTRLAVTTLLAALDPGRLLRQLPGGAERAYGLHLGGGKPFGLGSATTSLQVALSTARDRYGSDRPGVFGIDSFEVSPADLLRTGQLSRSVPQLARMLDLDGLGAWVHHVSYPPGADWGQVNSKDFDESFEFFRQNSGEQLANHRSRPYEPLPAVPGDLRAAFDPSLPVANRSQGRYRGGRNDGNGRR